MARGTLAVGLGRPVACRPQTVPECCVSRLLDVISLLMLVIALAMMCAGVYVMGNRDDVWALFLLVAGIVLLRGSIDLLRPRSAG